MQLKRQLVWQTETDKQTDTQTDRQLEHEGKTVTDGWPANQTGIQADRQR